MSCEAAAYSPAFEAVAMRRPQTGTVSGTGQPVATIEGWRTLQQAQRRTRVHVMGPGTHVRASFIAPPLGSQKPCSQFLLPASEGKLSISSSLCCFDNRQSRTALLSSQAGHGLGHLLSCCGLVVWRADRTAGEFLSGCCLESLPPLRSVVSTVQSRGC